MRRGSAGPAVNSFGPPWLLLPRTPANAIILDGIEELPPLRDGSYRDPYMEANAHPDLVEYLWEKLGPTLAEDCRCIAVSRPALARPDNGRIFAMATGTFLRLWLAEPDHSEARAAGYKSTWTSTSGRVTDIAAEMGTGWVFGRYSAQERKWILNSYAASADA